MSDSSGSILETFIILFTSNTDEVKKGASEAKKTTEELNASLSTTDKISKNLSESLGKVVKQYGGILVAALGIKAIISGINDAANYADRLHELSSALNVSVESLSAWGDAVKIAGGTIEGFQGSVQTITASLAQFATTGSSRAAPFFQSLGIQMTDAEGKARDLFEILPELATAFEGLGAQESFGLGQKLGLDTGTIMLLQKGSAEVDRIIARQKELGVITQRDAEIAAKYNDAWDDTAHSFRSLFTTIGTAILPGITKVIDWFGKLATFVRENADFMKGAITIIALAITGFLVPALWSAVVAAAPFLLIGAAIAAVAVAVGLIVDDIMTFFKGGDSITGDIIKWFKPVVDYLTEIYEKAAKIFKAIKSFFGGEDKVEVRSNIDSTGGLQMSADLADNLAKGGNALNFAATNPIGAMTSNSITNSSKNTSKNTNISTGDINIQTQATDATGIAKDIKGSLDNQIRRAQSTMDDGVLA